MQRLQSIIYWVCITSEISHFFCCGLPIVFSILSLLSGLGLSVAMPFGLESLHHITHTYEVPMIMMAGLLLCLGWGLQYIAYRIDCRSTGCVHVPCTPKKKRSGRVLIIATVLFVLNVTGYIVLHH
jgi:hypothetical protein